MYLLYIYRAAFVIKFKMNFVISTFNIIGELMDQFGDLMDQNNIVIGEIMWEDMDEKLGEQDILDQGAVRAKNAC